MIGIADFITNHEIIMEIIGGNPGAMTAVGIGALSIALLFSASIKGKKRC